MGAAEALRKQFTLAASVDAAMRRSACASAGHPQSKLKEKEAQEALRTKEAQTTPEDPSDGPPEGKEAAAREEETARQLRAKDKKAEDDDDNDGNEEDELAARASPNLERTCPGDAGVLDELFPDGPPLADGGPVAAAARRVLCACGPRRAEKSNVHQQVPAECLDAMGKEFCPPKGARLFTDDWHAAKGGKAVVEACASLRRPL